jgi:hypothetical protein
MDKDKHFAFLHYTFPSVELSGGVNVGGGEKQEKLSPYSSSVVSLCDQASHVTWSFGLGTWLTQEARGKQWDVGTLNIKFNSYITLKKIISFFALFYFKAESLLFVPSDC